MGIGNNGGVASVLNILPGSLEANLAASAANM